MDRGEVLLEQELHGIGDRLAQAAEDGRPVFPLLLSQPTADDADGEAGAVGPHPVLHERTDAALGVNRVGDQHEHDAKQPRRFGERGPDHEEKVAVYKFEKRVH